MSQNFKQTCRNILVHHAGTRIKILEEIKNQTRKWLCCDLWEKSICIYRKPAKISEMSSLKSSEKQYTIDVFSVT